jgi:hypothetical protein
MKDRYVTMMSLVPPAAAFFESISCRDAASDRWVKVPYSVLADTLIQAGCDAQLASVSNERERDRLHRVKAGLRDIADDVTIGAWITPPDDPLTQT